MNPPLFTQELGDMHYDAKFEVQRPHHQQANDPSLALIAVFLL
jgi:hypothetical protein